MNIRRHNRLGQLAPVILLLVAVLGCTQVSKQKEYVNRRSLVDVTDVIQPGEWRSWPFKVEETGARINGSFSTSEEKDYDILFYLTDPASKETLQSNSSGRYFYKSLDTRTNRHMNAVVKDLDPGEYYLLFRNESKDAARTVRIRMSLEY